MTFDNFYATHVAPLYTAAIDPARLQKAREQPWQFVWMVLLALIIGVATLWGTTEMTTAWFVFAAILVLSEFFYVQSYPYPDFEKPSAWLYVGIVVLGSAGGLIVGIGVQTGQWPQMAIGAIPLLLSVVFTVVQNPHRAALLRPYAALQNDITRLFFSQLYPGLYLTTVQGETARTFREMEIFGSGIDEVDSGISLGGKTGDTTFFLQKIKLIRVSKDSKGRTTRSTTFEGYWITLPQRNHLSAPVIVRPHRHFELVNLFIENTKRIELENPDFEQKFDVITTHEFEARRLLTPALMQQLYTFSENTLCPLHGIYFGVNDTHLALKSRETILETDFANPERVQKDLRQSAALLDQQLSLIETLCGK
jgi:hypothetical protein